MTFSGSADLQFIGNVTGLSLVHGVNYTVSVVARNSVGASETFTGTVFVPCEWDLTMMCGVYICVCPTLLPTPPAPPLPLPLPLPLPSPSPLQSLPTSPCSQWQ